MSWFQRTPPAHDHPPNPASVGWGNRPLKRAFRLGLLLTFGYLLLLLFLPEIRYSLQLALAGQPFRAPGDQIFVDLQSNPNQAYPFSLTASMIQFFDNHGTGHTSPGIYFAWDAREEISRGAFFPAPQIFLFLLGVLLFRWPFRIAAAFHGENASLSWLRASLFTLFAAPGVWLSLSGADYLFNSFVSWHTQPLSKVFAAAGFSLGLLGTWFLLRALLFCPLHLKVPARLVLIPFLSGLFAFFAFLSIGTRDTIKATYIPFQGWTIRKDFPNGEYLQWKKAPWLMAKFFPEGTYLDPPYPLEVTKTFSDGCSRHVKYFDLDYLSFPNYSYKVFSGISFSGEQPYIFGNIRHVLDEEAFQNASGFAAEKTYFLEVPTSIQELDFGNLVPKEAIEFPTNQYFPCYCPGEINFRHFILSVVNGSPTALQFVSLRPKGDEYFSKHPTYPFSSGVGEYFYSELYASTDYQESEVSNFERRMGEQTAQERELEIRYSASSPPNTRPRLVNFPIPHANHPDYHWLQELGYIDESGNPVSIEDSCHPDHHQYFEGLTAWEGFIAHKQDMIPNYFEPRWIDPWMDR